MGRGRGVNRTAGTPLAIDLLVDTLLPVTVREVVKWSDLRPARRDLMAARGAVLDNASDMATCFADIWNTPDTARQDRTRSVTNGYYRIFYNSEMSHSSVEVTYQPKGAGKKPRHAIFDLDVIADPEAWLIARVGPLASYDAIPTAAPTKVASDVTASRALPDLSLRLTSSMADILRIRRAAIDGLSFRLAALKPTEITNQNLENNP